MSERAQEVLTLTLQTLTKETVNIGENDLAVALGSVVYSADPAVHQRGWTNFLDDLGFDIAAPGEVSGWMLTDSTGKVIAKQGTLFYMTGEVED